ncbi:hypothetical protein [Mycolicibacterium porcinum]|uniref:Uncharacterized protein n=1 Tax=Mycolicibacterium porcinum TaxID=39693 RepID=A0ABV3VI74_9MYCO
MAKFRADKGYHFSQNGTDPWAHFELVPGSDPVVYEFETTDAKAISRLKKVDGIELVDKSSGGDASASADADAGGAAGDDGSGGGASA